jgi:hypothetical protein
LVSFVILSLNNSVLISFLTFDWKIAALIAEGHDLGRPAPVVYVSGEEVIFCFLILVRHILFFFQLGKKVHENETILVYFIILLVKFILLNTR